MATVEIKGGEKFNELAARIRRAEGELPRELMQALERAAPPLERAAKASAAENLPHRGGLAEIVASSGMSTQRRAGGIRIVAHGISQLKLTNDGRVRHPVFDRSRFVTQAIPKAKDWFYRPMRAGADGVRRELVKALDKIARKIA